MNFFNKMKNLSLAVTLTVAAFFVSMPLAQADDPVLLRQLDKTTDQNLQNENAQIQAAKAKNTVKK